jgi:hypothetical protein
MLSEYRGWFHMKVKDSAVEATCTDSLGGVEAVGGVHDVRERASAPASTVLTPLKRFFMIFLS